MVYFDCKSESGKAGMNHQRQDLPIGLQSFSRLIGEDFIYIDKTKYIHHLTTKGLYFFLSRPRRFGKSLLVSTLEELFLGNRVLFKNLYIDSTNYDWPSHPVILISFATMATQSACDLEQRINWALEEIAKRYGVDIQDAPSVGTKFKSLILKLATHNKVVVLIDEYDAAILKNIENVEVADACRTVLCDFFSALKDVEVDKQLRFVFITGISKFSKTSIFSGLNNLQDLSLDPRAAQLLGYTSEEIKTNYAHHIEAISKKTGKTSEEILEQIKFWYNGYQFVDPAVVPDAKVYNPYSVMLYLQTGIFDNYWFDTGTPSFLMRLLKKQDYPLSSIEGSAIHISQTKSYEIVDIKLVPLLWQAGYLTIESYNAATKNFRLAFPNEEVRNSFFENVMTSLTEVDPSLVSSAVNRLSEAIRTADLDSFFTTLRMFFAHIPYAMHISSEKFYQSLFFSVMALLGADITAEDPTNDGRIDATIETKTHILLFEFKLDASAESALVQIEEKRYYLKHQLKGKAIILIGVKFDTKKRNVTDWLAKSL